MSDQLTPPPAVTAPAMTCDVCGAPMSAHPVEYKNRKFGSMTCVGHEAIANAFADIVKGLYEENARLTSALASAARDTERTQEAIRQAFNTGIESVLGAEGLSVRHDVAAREYAADVIQRAASSPDGAQ